MGYFFKQLRFVKWNDIIACFAFIIALPISWFFKIKHKNLWLVCERIDEARDNGYWFYKYMRENHPEQECVYAIRKSSVDYEKVKSIPGKIIEACSLKHWIYYLTAKVNISSQKEGKPNAAVCHLLEIYGLRKNKRVYLKHGIVHNDLKWHYYDVTKMWLYICSAQREKDFCEKHFGYPEGSIVLTGLCRFDNLNDEVLDKKTVFIMPTSREWLARPIKEYEKYDNINDFSQTEYFKAWSGVLTNLQFNECIANNGLRVVFFLHPNMQKYSKHFEDLETKAVIKTSDDVDLQYMLKKAGMLITDYSSIFFDFSYMKKPLLYFQFDYEKFREGHYQEGYFSYKKDGFGKVCKEPNEIVEQFCNIVEGGMKMPPEYEKKVKDFFAFQDLNNSERVYKEIIKKLSIEKGDN